jgi:tetratricopeptide (TPR) repeat protein
MSAKKNMTPKEVFVGREPELLQLHALLEKTIKTAVPLVVFLQGDYGVGKTALAEQFFSEAIKKIEKLLIAKGLCSMESKESGLTPFIKIFDYLSNQNLLKKLVKENSLDFIVKVAPAWLDIITFGAASAVTTTIEEGSKLFKPKFSNENLYIQYTNAISLLIENRPTVFYLDDFHWADESSIRLLFHLANNLKSRAALFLVSYRPIEAKETGENSDLFRDVYSNLMRLSAQLIEMNQGIDVADYLKLRYPHNNFTEELIKQIQERTDGNPLFVTQVLSLWEDNNILSSRIGTDGSILWEIANNIDLSIELPNSLSAVLDERLRSMDSQLREILYRASIQGDEFCAQVITRVLDLDEYQIFSELNILEEIYRVIVTQGTSDLGVEILDLYRFANRYFRQHIYEKLNAGQKRILHRQVGQCMEVIYQNRLPVAGQLARHFEKANERFKSAEYALQAATYEQSRYAWPEAEYWCSHGIKSVQELIGRAANSEVSQLYFNLLEKSGICHYHSGDHTKARRRLEGAITFGMQAFGYTERLVTVYARLVEICENQGLISEAIRYVEQGKNCLSALDLGDTEATLDLMAQEGLLCTRRGHNEDAVKILVELQDKAELLPQTPYLKRVRADAYNSLAIALGYLDRYSESIPFYDESITLCKEVGDMVLASSVLVNQSDDYLISGRLDEADKAVSEALEIARRIGDPDNESYALYGKACVHLERGELGQAIDLFEQSIITGKSIGTVFSSTYTDLAKAYLSKNMLDEAYLNASKGIEVAETDRKHARALAVLGSIEAARGNYEKANLHFHRAIQLYQQEAGSDYYLALTKRDFGSMLGEIGEQDAALEQIAASLELFSSLNLANEIEITRQALSKLSTH